MARRVSRETGTAIVRPRARHGAAASSVGRTLVVSIAFGCFACGTTLLPTRAQFSSDLIPGLRSAGAKLGCHERASELFPLFLICPGDDQALGIGAVSGKLAISCPRLQHPGCRKLFARVQRVAEAARGSEQAPTSAEP